MPEVLTVREAVSRAKAEGLPVTEYTLRRWIKAGSVPVRTVGSKALLFYPNLVRFLSCEDGSDNPPAPVEIVPGIRRIGKGGVVL